MIESPRVQRAPRVTNTTNTQRLETIARSATIFPNGTIIRKKIGQAIQRGTVTRYDENRKYYWIDYENGDSEEMRHKYVEKYKCNDEPDIVRRKSNRIQQQTHTTTDVQLLAYAMYDEETGKMMEMRDLRNHPNKKKREEWDRLSANEYGRLMKGIGMKQEGKSRVQGCDTFHFIKKNQIPKGKKVTYARFCCDVRPQKEEKNRTRMTAGGDRLDYDGETTTETSTIETAKILINSTISTDNARFACWDIGNFYTNSRLPEPEYIHENSHQRHPTRSHRRI